MDTGTKWILIFSIIKIYYDQELIPYLNPTNPDVRRTIQLIQDEGRDKIHHSLTNIMARIFQTYFDPETLLERIDDLYTISSYISDLLVYDLSRMNRSL